MKSFLEIYTLASQTVQLVLQTGGVIEAPNWEPSGKTLLINGDGRLYRVPLDAPEMILVDTGFAQSLNHTPIGEDFWPIGLGWAGFHFVRRR